MWVKSNIKYVGDSTQYKSIEFWATALETLKSREGDCEDGAIVMANLMIKAGIPAWRIRITAGAVKGGYHAYLTYLPDSELEYEYDKQCWVICDWCYETNVLPMNERPYYKEEKNYYTDDIRFSFNRDYAFSTHGTVIIGGDD